jgi:hypothetical protein
MTTTDVDSPSSEDVEVARRQPGYANADEAEKYRLAVAVMLIRLAGPSVVSLRDAAQRADDKAIAAVDEAAADAREQHHRSKMADVVEAILEPFPPPANEAAGALHLTLREIDEARLPALYADAKRALRECLRVDECTDWASKAEALSSYARQSKDTELRAMADRIQARAIRRCGELLQEVKAARGRRTDLELRAGTHPKLPTRSEVATAGGLSAHQSRQALRIAAIAETDFEAAVESARPPSVTALAEHGKQQRIKSRDGEVVVVVPVKYRETGQTVEEIAVERQLGLLMAAWRDACPEARQRFLAILGCRLATDSPPQ